jgi:hypothetical protein
MNAGHALLYTLAAGLGLIAVPSSPLHAATVGAGDVVVLGVAGDSVNGFATGDGFSWATLVDLDPGQQISFTDASWNIQIAGGFNGLESRIVYTAPAGGIPAGTIFLVDLQSLPADHAYAASVETGAVSPMALSTFGDQIAVFTGRSSAPTFSFAVNTDQTQWTGSSAASATSSRSDLYAGLTDTVDAVAVGAGPSPGQEVDNAYYSGPTTPAGTATWLARIADSSNWTGEDDGLRVSELDMTAGLGAGALLAIDRECRDPVEAFLSVTRVSRRERHGRVYFSTSAILDVGLSGTDFGSEATITLGADTIVVPAAGFVPGTTPGSLVYDDGAGITVTLVPRPAASRYKLRISERGSSQPSDGMLAVGFVNLEVNATANVQIAGGRFRQNQSDLVVSSPPLALDRFRGIQGLPAGDRFLMLLRIPRDGTGLLPAAGDVFVCAGDHVQLIDAGDLTATSRGYNFYDRDVGLGRTTGIRRVLIDHLRGIVKVDARGVSLGTFPVGDAPLEVGFGIDGDDHAVEVLADVPMGGVILY